MKYLLIFSISAYCSKWIAAPHVQIKALEKEQNAMVAIPLNRDELGRIINWQKKDVRLSIIWKICENSEIKISDVFEVECSKEFNIENFVLTNGKNKYYIEKI